jgi:glycerophosphoryl diester phosphodiesterase
VSPDAPSGHVFDLQAHRGGAGLWPENTLEAFGRALALGVSTLELDVHLTAQDDVVVHHDPTVHGGLADARRIRELTRAELPPTMPLLRQVAALLDERGADPVRVNLEIKYDALDASGLTTREAFVDRVVDALRIDRMVERTSIQCFDWGVLRRVGAAEPALARDDLGAAGDQQSQKDQDERPLGQHRGRGAGRVPDRVAQYPPGLLWAVRAVRGGVAVAHAGIPNGYLNGCYAGRRCRPRTLR